MRKAAVSAVFLCLFASASLAQIVPPAPGVEIPEEVMKSIQDRGRDGFQFQHAWIKKAEAARELRERFIEDRGFYQRDMMPMSERPIARSARATLWPSMPRSTLPRRRMPAVSVKR